MRKYRRLKHKIQIDNVILFLCGFFVFSPISSYITINVLHFPLALPELLFLPFYFKIRDIFNLKVNLKIFISGIFILTILICIALLVGLFPVYSILSTARGYFYIILIFSIFKNKSIANIDYLFFIVFGATVGWMILGLKSLNLIMSNIFLDGSLATYGNMIALALFISIAIIYKKKISILIALGISIIISLSVGLRRQIMVTFVAFILSFLSQIKLSFKRILNIGFILLAFSILLINIYPIAKNFIEETSPTLYVRIFTKSEQLVTGDISTSDQTRINSFYKFIDNLENYFLPQGLVSKRTMTDKGTGIFMDSPYIELFHTFGIIFSIPIILYFFLCLNFHFKNYYRNKINESAICIVMGGVIIVLMFIEGSFLNFVYTTPLTGFVLARLASRKNLIA